MEELGVAVMGSCLELLRVESAGRADKGQRPLPGALAAHVDNHQLLSEVESAGGLPGNHHWELSQWLAGLADDLQVLRSAAGLGALAPAGSYHEPLGAVTEDALTDE